MTLIAVVILNYNGKALLEKFLPSVIKHSSLAKIIVVDNCSTDDSVAFLKSRYADIELIVAPANLGFCGGYNYALKQVDAKYYVLLNNDVEVTASWIDPMLSLLESDSAVAAAQPKVLSYNQGDKFEYAGAAGGFIDSLGYPFCLGRIFDAVETDIQQYNDRRPIFWATGACLFIRAELFHKLDGFDENFFAHMEEIDLCWKLKRMGHVIFYEGGSTVYHVGGGTLSVQNPKKTYYNFRNGLTMMVKHIPTAALLVKLPLRIILDWVAALIFLTRSPADAWAVLKAHAGFLGGIGKTLKKRRQLKGQIPNRDVTEVYAGILVVDFFLRKRKKFSELGDFNSPK